MNYPKVAAFLTAVSLTVTLPGIASASEGSQAKQICKQNMRDTYGFNEVRELWTEQVGNHKYKVHGKVTVNHHKYPFDCKVKNGRLKSFAYSGPKPRAHEYKDDDDNNFNTALAVGAGLAIVAALAAASDDNDRSSGSSQTQVKQTVLEDDCHDALQYRIRDEHNYTARVVMKDSRVEGHKLVGDAKVKYDTGHPNHASFTCHFDRQWQIKDSQYHLY